MYAPMKEVGMKTHLCTVTVMAAMLPYIKVLLFEVYDVCETAIHLTQCLHCFSVLRDRASSKRPVVLPKV